MNLIDNKKLDNPKTINIFSKFNDYCIQIDYYDKEGIKKIRNSIPLKYVLNKK